MKANFDVQPYKIIKWYHNSNVKTNKCHEGVAKWVNLVFMYTLLRSFFLSFKNNSLYKIHGERITKECFVEILDICIFWTQWNTKYVSITNLALPCHL